MEALIGAALSIVVAAATAWVTTHFRMKEAREAWSREFTLKLAEMQSEDSRFLREVSTQLAVGLLIHEDPVSGERDRYFLPSNFRGVVGRDEANLITLPDPDVSRQHCAFVADESNVFVEDLGSANATYLNGGQVQGREKLKSGDTVTLGSSRLDFHKLDN